MCNFFSALVKRNGEIISKWQEPSHEKLIELADLKDTKLKDRNFVRIELTLPEWDLFADVAAWGFRVDEEGTLPQWFLDNQAKFEKKCRAEAQKHATKLRRLFPGISKFAYIPNLTSAEAMRLPKEAGELFKHEEADLLLQHGFFYKAFWIDLHIELHGEECEVTLPCGKKRKLKAPLKSGWYKTTEFGLPFSAPSTSQDKEARYLNRWSNYVGLVSRWDGYSRRAVDCDGRPGLRLGVYVKVRNTLREEFAKKALEVGK